MRFQTWAVTLAGASLLASTSGAAAISREDARARVAAMEKSHAELLAKLPSLVRIDQVVRDDCAAKVTGHTSSDGFCECASAVTMSLWRTGVDPKMIGRLKDFLNGTGDLQAPAFVKFEGPELYRPLCELGA